MNAEQLRWHAAYHGECCEHYATDSLDFDEDLAAQYAISAAHYANLALERERLRDSPAQQIHDNQLRLAMRQALTLRCDCGGKLKRKTLRRELVGVECARCGRMVTAPSAQGVAIESTDGDAVVADVPPAESGADVEADRAEGEKEAVA